MIYIDDKFQLAHEVHEFDVQFVHNLYDGVSRKISIIPSYSKDACVFWPELSATKVEDQRMDRCPWVPWCPLIRLHLKLRPETHQYSCRPFSCLMMMKTMVQFDPISELIQ